MMFLTAIRVGSEVNVLHAQSQGKKFEFFEMKNFLAETGRSCEIWQVKVRMKKS